MPTQRDVALLADVSSASVSRYLNNPESLKHPTRERIRKAIEQLNYEIDYSAQVLKTGRFNNIGILAPAIGPFFWEALMVLQSVLSESGISTTMYFSRNIKTLEPRYTEQTLPFVKKRNIDALFFFPLLSKEDEGILKMLQTWGKPVVILDNKLAPGMPGADLPQVFFDNYQAGCDAARAFLDRGHRKFLFLWGSKDSNSAHERYRGFKDTLEAAGIDLGPDRQFECWFQTERAYQVIKAEYDKLPDFTAVFSSSDAMALGCMRALKERGMSCPHDYSILGFDDNLEFVPYLEPPLSTFRQPIAEFASLAGTVMLDLLSGRTPHVPASGLRPYLVERQSLRTIS